MSDEAPTGAAASSKGLSRRELMVFAGAGAAGASVGALTANVLGSVVMYGHWPDHGQSASKGPKYDLGLGGPDFVPEFITLVQIAFDDKWKMFVNQACFAFKGSANYEAARRERLARAIELFKLVRPKEGVRYRFRDIFEEENKPYPMPYGKDTFLDFMDFQRFGFNSQHEIFFYFDNPKIEFQDDYLISFAPMGDDGEERYRNYSFFNAEVVPGNLYGDAELEGKIVRVENYFSKSTGGKLDKKKIRKYAMNLHFQIKTTEDGYVPMVIDPDTGNGLGHDP